MTVALAWLWVGFVAATDGLSDFVVAADGLPCLGHAAGGLAGCSCGLSSYATTLASYIVSYYHPQQQQYCPVYSYATINDTASTQQQYQHILLSNAALSAIDHSLCPLDSYTSIFVAAQMQQY